MEEFHSSDESDPYSHGRHLAVIRSEVRALGRRIEDYQEDILAPAARQFAATRDAADRTIIRRLDVIESALIGLPEVVGSALKQAFAAGYVAAVRDRMDGAPQLRLVDSSPHPS